MLLLQRYLYWRFKNITQIGWRKNIIPDKLILEYERLKPKIEECYQSVTCWHGTGRYHYLTTGNSKYEEIDENKIVDVLEQIVEEGGLKPYTDPWVKINHQYSSSISTTPWRMYARVYAELHMYGKDKIFPVYGDRKSIVNFIFYYTMFSTPLKAFITSSKKALDKNKFANKMPIWARTINNSIRSKGNAYIDLLHIVGECTSNIRNNYGVLIGIDGRRLHEAKINPIVQMFETRFTKKIGFNHITHIEVPLKNVIKIQKMFKKHNINIPVLPIEVCEIFCSRQPIRFYHDKNNLPQLSRQEYLEHYTTT